MIYLEEQEMAGYNPYRKENGEFASKDELGGVESKVEADLTAARSADDSGRAEEIERYAMDKLPESKLGKSLLEARYGAAPAPTALRPSVSTEERYETLRESLSASGNYQNTQALGKALLERSDEELSELENRASAQLGALRPGFVWDSGIERAVRTERLRRTQKESFAVLTDLGYEYNGQGSYAKSGEKAGKKFFAVSRGFNLGTGKSVLMVKDGKKYREINSEDELRAEAAGSAKPSSARIPENIAAELKAAGVKRPMNWDEMGSSAKDRWEEAQYRALNR